MLVNTMRGGLQPSVCERHLSERHLSVLHSNQHITEKGGWLDNLTAILGTLRKGVR